MSKKAPPTGNIEALSSFVQGRALFDSFLETGSFDDLSEAAECFERSVANDRDFEIAKFYQAVCQTKLGETTKAIQHLERLAQHEQFALDALVQQASAYARSGEYQKAEKQLEKAEERARLEQPKQHERGHRRGVAARAIDRFIKILPSGFARPHRDDGASKERKLRLITAYRASILAIRGAAERDGDILRNAIEVAEKVDSEREKGKKAASSQAGERTDRAVRSEIERTKGEQADNLESRNIEVGTEFETKIAKGMAHMWLYYLEPAEEDWKAASDAFLLARELRPNSPHALYNLAMLHVCRGDRTLDGASARRDYYKANELIARTLEINPADDIARLTKALLSSKIGGELRPEEHGLGPEWEKRLRGSEEKKVVAALSELTKGNNDNGLRSTLFGDLPRRRAVRDSFVETTPWFIRGSRRGRRK
ncbi:MAG: hypothetical protein JOZ60_00010 [Verrucomicrobia bacterium]|nr:hypothetical protein [Verrucomicrobiota bacterium]